jgi:peroxiredoxin
LEKTMRFWGLVACVALLLCPALTRADLTAQIKEFPPGLFSDGGHYTLEDLKGKAVVLVFFEIDYGGNRGKVPEWNKLVEQYKDKPIKFLAVAPKSDLAKVQKYVNETRLEMPVYADSLRLMDEEWGTKITMDDARIYRILGPDGEVVGHEMTSEDIDKALAGVSWKFNEKDYDPKLTPIVKLLNWNQYQPAVKLLRPFVRKDPVTPLAKSANKLYAEVKSEGEQWKTDADGLVATDPVQAFDLYTKVSTVFTGDEFARSVVVPLRKLKTAKPVTDELAARMEYEQLYSALPRAKGSQRADAKAYCKGIVTQYPDTPTGKKADALATTLAITGG